MSLEKSFLRSDPSDVCTRIRCMLSVNHAIKETDASKGAMPYDESHALHLKPLRPKTVTQTTDVRSRAAWVDHIQRIRSDQDQTAFAELFQHFAPRVKAFLMKSGATEAMAEECTQEVMATLWHKAHMFDPSRASVATWIFTIARNRKIDALRKQRRPEPEDVIWGPEEEPDQEDVFALQEETEHLARALAELPDKQRDLIQKAYFGDLSHSEIAAETGLPLGTIKSRIRLALDRLRHAMK